MLKNSRQLLRSMQQFVLKIMCSKAGEEMENFMSFERDELISAMLRMNAANSSRKWRLIIKMRKWKYCTLLIYVQYVEDFCLCINVAGRVLRLPEKEIVKYFVSDS